MNVAFIVPAVVNRGPILVVKDLIDCLSSISDIKYIKLYYFDDTESQLTIDVDKERIEKGILTNFQDFDIVHSHGFRPDRYVYKHRNAINAICISTMHNIIREEYRANYNQIVGIAIEKLWSYFLRRHDVIVSLNRRMFNYYKAMFVNKPVEIINNGRNVDHNKPISHSDSNKLLELRNRYKIIGTICVLNKRKGVHQLIKAIPFLETYAAVIVGDGPEMNSLRKLAQRLCITDRCIFVGSKSFAYVYCQFFDIFTLPSYMEGLPLALLEAASYGLPLLCSNIEVHKEIFDSSEAFFFELDNTSNFIEGVRTLEANRHLYSKRCRRKFTLNYTGTRMAKNYLELYEKFVLSKTSL